MLGKHLLGLCLLIALTTATALPMAARQGDEMGPAQHEAAASAEGDEMTKRLDMNKIQENIKKILGGSVTDWTKRGEDPVLVGGLGGLGKRKLNMDKIRENINKILGGSVTDWTKRGDSILVPGQGGLGKRKLDMNKIRENINKILGGSVTDWSKRGDPILVGGQGGLGKR